MVVTCEFTISIYLSFLAFDIVLISFYHRVLLVVSSLRKKFAGVLSETEILGSKHVMCFCSLRYVLYV